MLSQVVVEVAPENTKEESKESITTTEIIPPIQWRQIQLLR